MSWLPQASQLIRYEDLLPAGEDWAKPIETVRGLLSILGGGLEEDEIRAVLKRGSNPEKSATFYRGGSGRWREAFSTTHVMQFKSVAPNLVSLLGYERDEHWGIAETEEWQPAAPATPPNLMTAPPAEAAAGRGAPETVPQVNRAAHRKLEREIESIREVLKRLRNLDEQVHLRVSFLQMEDYGFLHWTDDYLQSVQNSRFWDHKVYFNFLEEERIHPSPEVARALPESPGATVLHRVIRPLLAKGFRARFLDVGCYYGKQSILLSSMLSDFGDAFQITAFDCGWPGKLAPFNFEMNGHKDRITFEPLAVAQHNRTSIIYGEYGEIENCRTVNRNVVGETFSYPCESTTLDSYVRAKNIKEPLFLEIELQGGEYHALLGAQKVLGEQCYGALVKFIPHALQPSIEPENLLSAIPGNYRIFDVVEGQRFEEHEIAPEHFGEFARQLRQASPDWTFLLLLFDRYYAAVGK
jgi:FkbM family methyltransferase